MSSDTESNPFARSYDEPLRSKSPLDLLVYLTSGIFFLFVAWYAYTVPIPEKQYAIVVLGVMIFLWGITRAQKTSSSTSSKIGVIKQIGYFLYSLIAIVPTYYFATNYSELRSRIGIFTQTDIIMGLLLIVLILIAVTYVSRLISIVAISGLIYSYFGNYMPGILQHSGLSFQRIVTMNTAEMSGIFGNFLVIVATWILMFMLFAGFLEAYGGMTTFINGASNLVDKSDQLRVGQVGVLASMAMGSINGSIAANTATTGTFTIPLMKSRGYQGRFAGAIESVASTGGQILPPIMGAAAFVMASLIEPSYPEIVIAAVAPALLFFLTVAFSVQINAAKHGISEMSDPTSSSVTLRGIISHYEFLISFVVLLYYLVYLQVSPTYAGLYTITTLVLLRIVRIIYESATKAGQTFKSRMTSFIRQTIAGTKRGTEATIDLAIMFVALAIVVRAFVVTGLAPRISTNLVTLAQGSLILLLIFAMIASIVFGMAVSTTPAYLLVAILVAPALTQAGIQPLLAHFFVFMFAIAAGITPPIAVGVLVATGIAESNFWDTALDALKIGYPILVLPYTIFLHPELIYINNITIVVFAVVLIGLLSLSMGITGFFRVPLARHYRAFYLLAGIVCLFTPTQYISLGILSGTLILAVTIHGIIGVENVSERINTIRR